MLFSLTAAVLYSLNLLLPGLPLCCCINQSSLDQVLLGLTPSTSLPQEEPVWFWNPSRLENLAHEAHIVLWLTFTGHYLQDTPVYLCPKKININSRSLSRGGVGRRWWGGHSHTNTHVSGSISLSCPSGIEVLSLSNLSRLSHTDGWQTDKATRETGAPGHKQSLPLHLTLAPSQPQHTAADRWLSSSGTDGHFRNTHLLICLPVLDFRHFRKTLLNRSPPAL